MPAAQNILHGRDQFRLGCILQNVAIGTGLEGRKDSFLVINKELFPLFDADFNRISSGLDKE